MGFIEVNNVVFCGVPDCEAVYMWDGKTEGGDIRAKTVLPCGHEIAEAFLDGSYIRFRIPGLFKKQPCGNFHPFWHRLCFCREHEYCGDWKGGILDLKTGQVYVRKDDKQEDSGRDALGKCPDCGFESPLGKCPICGGWSLRQVWELCYNQKKK